ncbi:MAG: DNA-formamidopyrimidine glycosylase family protein [Thermoanaerobaculia bacterium]
MPELPDVTVYVERLNARLAGQPLEQIRIASPFLLRSVTPPLKSAQGVVVRHFERLAKRIVFACEGELFLVVHLMISGRLKWRERGAKIPARLGLAAFDFPSGSLLLTEASTKKRAWLRLVEGREALAALDPGGLEVLGSSLEAFAGALRSENHTLKRSLTDPRLFSGIGNSYSDEILHRARLSPVLLTQKMKDEDVAKLHAAVTGTLLDWTGRLRQEVGDGFPEKVTAFREGMAVHGRFGKPCPTCGGTVQRIAYADNETNYCPRCQTGGRLLADRGLSRLLKDDWPKTPEALEELHRGLTGTRESPARRGRPRPR